MNDGALRNVGQVVHLRSFLEPIDRPKFADMNGARRSRLIDTSLDQSHSASVPSMTGREPIDGKTAASGNCASPLAWVSLICTKRIAVMSHPMIVAGKSVKFSNVQRCRQQEDLMR